MGKIQTALRVIEQLSTSKKMMLEQNVQKKILSYLNSLDNCWCCKVISTSRNGTPDIIGVLEGRLFGLEVKRPGNKASKIQEYQIAQIQKAGGIAAVVYSVDDVKNLLTLV